MSIFKPRALEDLSRRRVVRFPVLPMPPVPLPVALVIAPVWRGPLTIPVLHAFFEGAGVLLAVGPGEHALSAELVVVELSFIHLAVLEFVDASAVELAVEKFALVRDSVHLEDTSARFLAMRELALVGAAIVVKVLAAASVKLIVQPLALVVHALLVEEAANALGLARLPLAGVDVSVRVQHLALALELAVLRRAAVDASVLELNAAETFPDSALARAGFVLSAIQATLAYVLPFRVPIQALAAAERIQLVGDLLVGEERHVRVHDLLAVEGWMHHGPDFIQLAELFERAAHQCTFGPSFHRLEFLVRDSSVVVELIVCSV